jgi:histone H2B
MNDFVNDMFVRIATEAGRLVQISKTPTMNSDTIQSAIKLMVPGELGDYAMNEGNKSLKNMKNTTFSQNLQ